MLRVTVFAANAVIDLECNRARQALSSHFLLEYVTARSRPCSNSVAVAPAEVSDIIPVAANDPAMYHRSGTLVNAIHLPLIGVA
jgi:hypothetical protein